MPNVDSEIVVCCLSCMIWCYWYFLTPSFPVLFRALAQIQLCSLIASTLTGEPRRGYRSASGPVAGVREKGDEGAPRFQIRRVQDGTPACVRVPRLNLRGLPQTDSAHAWQAASGHGHVNEDRIHDSRADRVDKDCWQVVRRRLMLAVESCVDCPGLPPSLQGSG